MYCTTGFQILGMTIKNYKIITPKYGGQLSLFSKGLCQSFYSKSVLTFSKLKHKIYIVHTAQKRDTE